MTHYFHERKADKRKGINERNPHMVSGRSLSVLIVIGILMSVVFYFLTGDGNGGRSWNNESFETATEISADGSLECLQLNFNDDPVDYLKFFLAPPQGKSINATIYLSAETISHTFFVTVYSPDRLPIHYETVRHGDPPMDYSFWAGSKDFYYMSIATFNNLAAYETRVNTTVVDHTPDGNNNMSHAPVLTPHTIISERVNKTTDYYDIYRIHVDANATHGEGLFVHLNNFTDVNLKVYDTNRTLRAESCIVQSSDPNVGETIRFVANRTGFYYIVVIFEVMLPENSFANYNLTVNTTPGLPRDEDWCPGKGKNVTICGGFESFYKAIGTGGLLIGLNHYLWPPARIPLRAGLGE